ncbi:MBL fold metallo-hydrolase [Methanoregula sp.]|jgi:glyoxylase-like metal-dependent hydrolase (beta-lactamase superfamily II)|uniref:MBL fold metallo-hydrolase n=1 Tax=Methanoregula sp. TaxID=2052170 RepID=UPI003C1571E4
MEIVPGIHQVDGVNGNSYILVRDGLTVIDTGIPGSGKKILAYIRETLHRNPREIRTIIITHFHMDHIGGVSAIKKEAPDVKVAVGDADAGYVTGALALPVHPGFRGLLLRIVGLVMKPGAFKPDLLLKDRDRIDGLTCIAIPGHTPGSIGLLDEATGTFFAGDILRYDGTTLAEGPAPFTMDLSRSRQSIRAIGGLDFDLLLTGHGVPLRPGASAAVRAFAGTLPPADG